MLDGHDEAKIQESVNRFIEYALSPELHFRASVGSTALETLPIVSSSPKDVATVLEFLSTVAVDSEVDVRCNVLEYIVHIALMLSDSNKSCETLRSFITSHILPIIVTALLDKESKVVKMADNSLIALLEHCLVPNSYVKERIWPVINKRKYDHPATDSIIRVLTLMSKMVPWVGCDTTETLFVPLFVQLCSYPDIIPRKACASIIGDFCAVVSLNTVENKLVPCFLTLCSDSTWVVRKACAEAFTSVSSAASSITRKERLARAFAILLTDPLEYVRSAAFESLGPFITTFAQPSITNLEYNRQGKLVLRHPDGFEFLLNTNIGLNMAERYSLKDSFGSNSSDLTRLLYESVDPSLDKCLNSDDEDWPVVEYTSHRYEEEEEEQDDSVAVGNNVDEDTWDIDERLSYCYNPLSTIHRETTIIDKTDSHIDRDVNNSSLNHDIKEEVNSKEENVESIPVSCDNKDIDTQPEKVEEDTEKLNSTPLSNSNDKVIQSEETGTSHSVCSPSVAEKIHVEETIEENQKEKCSEDEKDFSGFLYWRDPIPDIDIDVKLSANKPRENTVRIASIRLYSSPQPTSSHSDSTRLASLSSLDHDKYSTSKKSEIFYEALRQLIESNGNNCKKRECKGSSVVPDELISHFVSMSSPRADKNQQNQLAHHCAYNLPAVALTLGPDNWALIRQACSSLAADQQWRVRRIVASSIHELAVIVGSDVATEDLVPVFSGFIKDLDEVRIGALKHLANFLKLLKPSGRNTFLPLLTEFLNTDYEWNWRFRAELAEQLVQIVRLFSPCDVSAHLTPVVFTLLQDKVAHVRSISVQLVVEVIKVIRKEGVLVRSAVAELAEQFAHSSRWSRRQTFAHLCSKLVEEKALPMDMFARDILPHLLDLSWDVVPNVRLSVARTLSHHIMTLDTFSNASSPHHEVVMIVLKRLQTDKDRDVRYFANLMPPDHTSEPPLVGEEDECIKDVNYTSNKFSPTNCSDDSFNTDEKDNVTSNYFLHYTSSRDSSLSTVVADDDEPTESPVATVVDSVKAEEEIVAGSDR